jgi:acetyl-CoA synthetase/medium-chain acyl-CoA synthetase
VFRSTNMTDTAASWHSMLRPTVTRLYSVKCGTRETPSQGKRRKEELMPNIGDYETTYANFEWEMPEKFNFGRDVVDAWEEDRPAMIWLGANGDEQHLTFGDFSRLSNKFANVAKEMGIRRGDRVMVLMGHVPEWHVVLTALLKLGAIAVPNAAQLRANELRFRAQHTGSVAIISGPQGVEEIDAVREEVPELRRFVSLGGEHEGWESYEALMEDAPDAFAAEDTTTVEDAFILYTSGTTAHPKGALHTVGYTYVKRVLARYWLNLREGDRVWCTAATGWAKNIWNVLGPWSLGSEIFVYEGTSDPVEPFDPVEDLGLIARYGITVLCQAPTEYRALANTPEFETADLSSVRHAVTGGDTLNPWVIERFEELHGITIYEGYGQTETTRLVANFPGLEIKPGSMGKPAPGCDVRVIDQGGNELPPGEQGDIALSADNPGLMKGYWRQPEQTEAVMRNGFYLTGDRATRDEDGYIWFAGRSDDVIISAGARIDPLEVEEAIMGHPAIAECAAVGKPDKEWGEIVKVYVVLTGGYEVSEELIREIQEYAKSVTDLYKYLREIEFIDELPKTATSGKIRRGELRQRATEKTSG